MSEPDHLLAAAANLMKFIDKDSSSYLLMGNAPLHWETARRVLIATNRPRPHPRDTLLAALQATLRERRHDPFVAVQSVRCCRLHHT